MNQKKIAELRFLGYVGTQFTALLAPLLVFQLTHSATLAGTALLLEWVPKLAFYFLGGSIAQRFGLARTHLVLDIARLGALGLFTAAALGYGSVWLVAGAAAIYQCSNALSNILFELSVTTHWQRADHAQGHALMMKRSLQACLLALVLGLVINDPLVLCGVAVLVQILAMGRTLGNLQTLYPARTGATGDLANFRHQLRQDLAVFRKRSILRFSLASMFLNVPVALIFSALTFYLDRAQPGIIDGARTLSLILLAKTALDVLMMEWVQRKLKIFGGEKFLAGLGTVCLLGGAALAVFPLSLGPAVMAAFAIGLSTCLYQPWVRTYRQSLLHREIPPHSHAGATGILISVEASSRLVGAALLGLFGTDLTMALAVAAVMALIGLIMQHRNVGFFRSKSAHPASDEVAVSAT